MKKLIFALCALMAWSGVIGQNAEIFIDKVDADGFRTIATKSVNCRNGMTDRHPMMFAVTCCAQDDKQAWTIAIDFPDVRPFKINKGALMLIKLNDDSIIELKQMFDANDVEDIIGTYNATTKMRTHVMRAAYEVTPDQLVRIGKIGVAKIRIERPTDTFDVEYKKDKVGPAIDAAYMTIAATLNKPKNIRSDF